MKTNSKIIFQYSLGALVVIGFFALMFVLTVKDVPAGSKDALNLVIGALIAAFSAIIGYFYGSSLGSSQKTNIMANGNKPA